MKKAVSITVILVILLSMLPVSAAFAKSGGSSLLSVRNRAGGDVTITLYSDSGSNTLTYEVGTYFSSVGAGTYSFYAVTPCGVQSGIINLTRNKQLYFSCNKGRTIQLQVPVAPDGAVAWDCPAVPGLPAGMDGQTVEIIGTFTDKFTCHKNTGKWLGS